MLATRTQVDPDRIAFRRRCRPSPEWLESRRLLTRFTVTDTSDSVVDTGSLRYAITHVQDGDSIAFEIPTSDPGYSASTHSWTIAPKSALPAITHGVDIDGTTQPGFAGNPVLVLDGAAAGPTAIGLEIRAVGCKVKGLVINGFGGSGIVIGSGAASSLIQGNRIGTSVDGTQAMGNRHVGISIQEGARFNTVGGTSLSARNLISANLDWGVVIFGTGTTANLVEGNYIGTDWSGSAAVGNGNGLGIYTPGNTIGGTAAGAGNVISGNTGDGIALEPAGGSTLVQGNVIGPNAAGTATAGNLANGVRIQGSNNTIGGTTAGAANTIAGNTTAGVVVLNDAATGNRIQGNSIFGNGGLGIDLGGDGVTPNHDATTGSGPNHLENHPLIWSAAPGAATTVTASVLGPPNASVTIDFYASPEPDPSGHGQGRRYLGSVLVATNATGLVNPTPTFPLAAATAAGEWITATATDAAGNTSEFSNAVLLPAQSVGSWTPVWNVAPSDTGTGTMLLLSDGTVMVQGGGVSKAWYALAPDPSGSYAGGTWSQLASMSRQRLYYPSNILPDGRVFLAGGEYSGPNGDLDDTNTGEIYDPVTNTWMTIPDFPEPQLGDDPSQLLPDGRVLVGYLLSPQTYIYDPGSNTWSFAAAKLNGLSAEETWIKLPDDSILAVGIGSDDGLTQRYIPATNTWVLAGRVPVALSDANGEMGPAFLLPDGRAFFVGATGHTVFYTPSTSTWTAGPDVPNGLVADDAPGAMMPDGNILLAVDTPPWQGPTSLFVFNPTTGAYTDVTPTAYDLGGSAYVTRMLMLPSGQVLLTNGSSRLLLYTPSGAPDPSWQPQIAQVTANGDGTYTLTGTQLNGISQGASYGDDAEMDTNYPIVRLESSGGSVFYARTSHWSSTGVATGGTSVSTRFRLPTGLPKGSYSLYTIANGIASPPWSFTNGLASMTTIGSTAGESVYGQVVTLTVTVQSAGGSGPTPTGTVQLVINGVDFGDPIDLIGGSAAIALATLPAGIDTITAVYSGDAAYFDSSGMTSQTVDKASLIVVADDQTQTYDGSTFTGFTVHFGGFADGDTRAVIAGVPSFSGSSVGAANAGSYSIIPDLGSLSAANYDFVTFVNGTLTITRAHLTVTAADRSRTYDGTAFAGFTARYSGFVPGETASVISGSAGFGGPATSAVNAGGYAILPGLGSLSAANYDFPTFLDGTLTITKAPLSVTADDLSRTYNGSAFAAFTAHFGGFVHGETAGVVTGAPSFSGPATAAVVVGSYSLIPGAGTLGAANYEFTTFVQGTLTITRAHLTVTAGNQSKIYDGSAFAAFTAHYSGFAPGETTGVIRGGPSFSGPALGMMKAGSHPIIPGPGSLSAANYEFTTFVSGTLTIARAHLTVTAADRSRTYDGSAIAGFTAHYSGFVPGETASVVSGAPSFSGSALGAVNAGRYEIIPGPGGLTAANYDFTTFVNGTSTIARAHLTVTAADQSRTYDGSAIAGFTAHYSGFVPGETASVVSGAPSFSGSALGAVNAGRYEIIPGLGSLTAANYDFTTFISGVLTVAMSPPVTMRSLVLVTNSKRQATQIVLGFSGALNAASAQQLGPYRLATAGKLGSFTAKNAKLVRLLSATYDPASDTVTLVPKKPLSLTRIVQLQVNGPSSPGLSDRFGRMIDGDRDGQPGGTAIALLRRGGATLAARTGSPPPTKAFLKLLAGRHRATELVAIGEKP